MSKSNHLELKPFDASDYLDPRKQLRNISQQR